MKKKHLTIAFCSLFFTTCSESTSNKPEESTSIKKELSQNEIPVSNSPTPIKKESISWENAKTKDEVEKCIDGVWISNPTSDIWTKVVLSNGTYKLYDAMPSSGQWGDLENEGTFEIKEDRLADTGKLYCYVALKESGMCNYRIVFAGDGIVRLRCGKNYVPIAKGDHSPWD